MRCLIYKFIYQYFSILFLIILFSALCIYTSTYNKFDYNFAISDSAFFWPLSNNHKITSYFGPRKSPTKGASSIHSGIDIAASENTPIYSILPCIVVSTGFKGAGGYTITTQSDKYKISYCHVSPNFIVSPGDFVDSRQCNRICRS